MGGGSTGEQTQQVHVGRLVGRTRDAQGEELDAQVLGVSHRREDVRVPRVGDAVCEQHGHLDAAEGRLLPVDPGHVSDGVGGVGAVADVDNGSDLSPEVLDAPPVPEGLLRDDVTAVLQESHPEAQAAARLQPDALESLHDAHGKLLLLLVVVLGALRAVQQEGELQAAVFVYDGCACVNVTSSIISNG